MPFWLDHRFRDHTSEILEGDFITGSSRNKATLSNTARAIAQAILACLESDESKTDPLYQRKFGFRISRSLAQEYYGKRINAETWAKVQRELESAEVFEIDRTDGGNNKGNIFRFGATLDCENYSGCRLDKHNPDWLNRSEKLRGGSGKRTPPLIKAEEPPQVSLDINNISIATNSDLNIFGEVQSFESNPKPLEPDSEPERSTTDWRSNLDKDWIDLVEQLIGDNPPRPSLIGFAEAQTQKGIPPSERDRRDWARKLGGDSRATTTAKHNYSNKV